MGFLKKFFQQFFYSLQVKEMSVSRFDTEGTLMDSAANKPLPCQLRELVLLVGVLISP